MEIEWKYSGSVNYSGNRMEIEWKYSGSVYYERNTLEGNGPYKPPYHGVLGVIGVAGALSIVWCHRCPS